MKTAQFRPLVLLDVDGVINDLEVLAGQRRPWRTDLVHSNGFAVMVPDYMPALIQTLVDTCEVWWCTTWRDLANSEIASHLGIPHLPVVTDGSISRCVDWKAAAARELVSAAIEDGRSVYWIEDFHGDPPTGELPDGVVYIDTTLRDPRCVLHEDDLPTELRQRLAGDTPSWEVT